MVAEYRALTAAMTGDLKQLSAGPTADSYTAFDRSLDFTTLKDYLRSRGAGALISQVLDVAYTIEFGREIEQQSALSFLFFAQASRRSVFKPFGVFSDERFHIVEGNDRVATGLAALLPAPVAKGHRLVKVSRLADGRIKPGDLVLTGNVTLNGSSVVIIIRNGENIAPKEVEDLLVAQEGGTLQVAHAPDVLVLGATLLAGNNFEPHHAFRFGSRAWGVQFHPEFGEAATHAYLATLNGDVPEGAVRPTDVAASVLPRFARIVRG